MTALDPAEVAAQRIDQLLQELRSRPDRRAADLGEELTRCLVQLYGAGLARIADRLGPGPLAELCADPLVESLLLVHDLHPVDAGARIERALAGLRLAGEPELLGIDDAGVVRLRLTGAGCPSSRQAAVRMIEAAVARAAPEATGVVVETPPAPPPLLRVSLRPGLS